MKAQQQTLALLKTLNLQGVLRGLDEMINDAESRKISYLGFLNGLLTAEVQKTAEYRIRRLMKSDLVIIDEIGYTPIEKREANLFFNMISELYERASIIITSNKSFEAWAEMMGDAVMTTALLDRLLHHAKVYTLDGDSYQIKKSRKEVYRHYDDAWEMTLPRPWEISLPQGWEISLSFTWLEIEAVR